MSEEIPDEGQELSDTFDPDQVDDMAVAGVAAGPTAVADERVAAGTRKQIRKEQRRVLFTSPGFIIGVLIIVFWVLSAIAPGLLTEWGPKEFVTDADGNGLVRESPGADAWFGTDNLGRDVYSRVIHGVRPILQVAPLATLLAIVVGTLMGLFMGYFLGWVDEVLSRIIESILSIPSILMAILVIFTFGKTDPVVTGTIAVLFVPPVARTVRAATIAEAQLDYVTSAKMRGERSLYIIAREIFPNITGVIVVEFTVRLGYAIFTLATLAFLGLAGGDITDPDWGVDVSESWTLIVTDLWWPTIFPAIAIATLVIAVNLVADSIDKALRS